ncbi:hypothetical protein PBT90_08200 [Algoriphagus halophytocola]|uniref:Uncharacterized protein n=1 Tax=Algoriphagus halophytocola TaxID=2991499 RepID=A0ABY6MHU5_9BACT|nr:MULTISPECIES: hypothetical protein [unclassified Algoriphagus]UZD23367.1 hypothetical protein OM944_02515 [Algoriphagus sp. TR-M5]WBL44662.1 hypothetical protein PBT90_08200 [Algoriphagus sp. TR-M9]
MDNLMTRQLDLILREGEVDFEREFELVAKPDFLDQKGKNWLAEIYEDLGGKKGGPLLEKFRFDFKIGRNLFLYDDELHFNRYRLISFRSDLYNELNFEFVDAQRRLCRSFEKECLKVGMQERVWYGPPIAKHCFGAGSEPGDFSGNGAIGWKLFAYNDAQMDLQTRIHGYKLHRITPFETLMTGGSLKRLDQLLINPKEEQRVMLLNWFNRKYQD